ncbi:MAG: alpha/beta hydrolase [Candidatus Sericytochromatia bacterium]
MRRRWFLAALMPLLLLAPRLAALAQESPFLTPPADNPFAALAARCQALDLQQQNQDPDYLRYLAFYGLDQPGVQHFAGYVPSGSDQVFVHVFRPTGNTRGTVVTLHGYYVHTGLLVHLINRLLNADYTVVSVDLPGHGLSSGPRASIEEFGRYALALQAVSERIRSLPGPFSLIGHSTGGAGVWEYLLQQRTAMYAKAVLVAPLVRSAFWELSLAGFWLGQGWLQEIPRVVGPTSSDPSFFAMVRRDPLQYPGTPVQWVRALIQWNEHVIESYPPSNTPLLILQGTEDTVVDWKFNLPFLQRKFLHTRVEILTGARHDLLWEAPAIREQVFERILDFLNH